MTIASGLMEIWFRPLPKILILIFILPSVCNRNSNYRNAVLKTLCLFSFLVSPRRNPSGRDRRHLTQWSTKTIWFDVYRVNKNVISTLMNKCRILEPWRPLGGTLAMEAPRDAWKRPRSASWLSQNPHCGFCLFCPTPCSKYPSLFSPPNWDSLPVCVRKGCKRLGLPPSLSREGVRVCVWAWAMCMACTEAGNKADGLVTAL